MKSQNINPQLTARLERYKANAQKSLEAVLKHYPNAHPEYIKQRGDWRENRYPRPAILSRGNFYLTHSKDDPRIVYADSFESLPLTLKGDAYDLARGTCCGWYISEFFDETQKGAVLSFRNPHKLSIADSHLFYVAGTYNSDADGVTVYLDVIHDTPEDAARYADECARIEAEAMREENARYQQEQEREEAREQLHELNKNTLQLIREIKQSRDFSPAICEALTDTIKAALRERRKLLATIAGA